MKVFQDQERPQDRKAKRKEKGGEVGHEEGYKRAENKEDTKKKGIKEIRRERGREEKRQIQGQKIVYRRGHFIKSKHNTFFKLCLLFSSRSGKYANQIPHFSRMQNAKEPCIRSQLNTMNLRENVKKVPAVRLPLHGPVGWTNTKSTICVLEQRAKVYLCPSYIKQNRGLEIMSFFFH